MAKKTKARWSVYRPSSSGAWLLRNRICIIQTSSGFDNCGVGTLYRCARLLNADDERRRKEREDEARL